MTKLNIGPEAAIELWKRWFDWSGGDPWFIASDEVSTLCFFCGEDEPNHKPDCVFVEAKKLVEAHKKGESSEA